MKRLNSKFLLVTIIFIIVFIICIQVYSEVKSTAKYKANLDITKYEQTNDCNNWIKGKDNDGIEVYFYKGGNYKIDK